MRNTEIKEKNNLDSFLFTLKSKQSRFWITLGIDRRTKRKERKNITTNVCKVNVTAETTNIKKYPLEILD